MSKDERVELVLTLLLIASLMTSTVIALVSPFLGLLAVGSTTLAFSLIGRNINL